MNGKKVFFCGLVLCTGMCSMFALEVIDPESMCNEQEEVCSKIEWINQQDFLGYTDLHRAVIILDKDMTEKLLKQGANPNLLDNEGRTPLLYAVYSALFGDSLCDQEVAKEIITILLRHGADSSIKDHDGKSPEDLYHKSNDTKKWQWRAIVTTIKMGKNKLKSNQKASSWGFD